MPFDGFRAYDGNHAPKPPFELNKDSPQAVGLSAWYPFYGGHLLRDFSGFNRDFITINGTPVIEADSFTSALGANFVAVDNDRMRTGTVLNENDALSIIIVASIRDMSTWDFFGRLVEIGGATTADGGIGIERLAGGDTLRWIVWDGATNVVVHSVNFSPEEEILHQLGFTSFSDGSTNSHIAYIDGIAVATNTIAVRESSITEMTLAAANFSPGNHGGATFNSVSVYNDRIVSAGEMADAWAKPWDLAFQPGRVTYFVPAVVGAANPKGPLGHPLHGPFGGPI